LYIYTQSINSENIAKYSQSFQPVYGIRAKRATHVVSCCNFLFFFSLKPFLKHLCCIFFQMASSSTATQTEANPITQNSTETNPTTANLTQTQPPIPVTQLSSFAQSITKLHKDNFMSWRGLVEPFLKGHDLYGFIDGTNTPPSPQVSTSPNGTLTVSTDPDTLWWLR
jgi:hypothetical protein